MAKAVLERSGHHVLAASSPVQALAIAETHATPIHLLITDVGLPEMTGFQLAGHLEEKFPAMKVLYISGNPTDGAPPGETPQENFHFLLKPFTNKSLSLKVREILDQA